MFKKKSAGQNAIEKPFMDKYIRKIMSPNV